MSLFVSDVKGYKKKMDDSDTRVLANLASSMVILLCTYAISLGGQLLRYTTKVGIEYLITYLEFSTMGMIMV